MEASESYVIRVSEGIAKIKEGFQQVEAEQNKLKAMTLGADDACKYYGISLPTLIKRRKQDMIPFIKIGVEFRYLKVKAEVTNV